MTAPGPGIVEKGECPLVTVVMPAYNSREFVADAIQSVIDQTYRPLQLVIGDDGSTDGTADIVRDYAARYPDLIDAVLHPANIGMLRNVDSLYPHIKGDYVAWFAGDDLFYPDKIAAQMDLMLAHPDCTYIFHDVDVVDAKGAFIQRYNDPVRGQKAHLADMPANLLRHRCYVPGLSVMVNRKAAGGIRHRTECGPCCDWLMAFELAAKGPVLYIDRPLGAYRRHGNNITRKADIAWENRIFDFAEAHYPLYRDDIDAGRASLQFKFIFKYALRRQFRDSFNAARTFLTIAMKNPQAGWFVLTDAAHDLRNRLTAPGRQNMP